MSHEEDSNGAQCKQQGHSEEAESVNHSGNQEPLLILLQREQTFTLLVPEVLPS